MLIVGKNLEKYKITSEEFTISLGETIQHTHTPTHPNNAIRWINEYSRPFVSWKIPPLESIKSFSLPFILPLLLLLFVLVFGVPLFPLIPWKLVFPKTLFSFLFSHFHAFPSQSFQIHPCLPTIQCSLLDTNAYEILPLGCTDDVWNLTHPKLNLSSSVHFLAFSEWILAIPSTPHVLCSSL